MSDDQVGCEWVNVSSCTGLPRLYQTNAVKWLCVCVCVCVGKNYDSACNNVLLDNCAIAFEDSITYLGTLIRAGRTWRTDSSPGRRQCFGAFNSIFC